MSANIVEGANVAITVFDDNGALPKSIKGEIPRLRYFIDVSNQWNLLRRASPYQPEALEIGRNRPPVGPEGGITFVPMYLSNRMKSIAGGSSEIQRNIVAKAILRL